MVGSSWLRAACLGAEVCRTFVVPREDGVIRNALPDLILRSLCFRFRRSSCHKLKKQAFIRSLFTDRLPLGRFVIDLINMCLKNIV